MKDVNDKRVTTRWISWGSLPHHDGLGKPPLLSSRVAQHIEHHIVQQGMKPGDRLPSGRELAEMFAVSRTVIRDAILALEQRGLVEVRPGSGLFVADGSSKAVGDVLGQMLRLDEISFVELVGVRRLIEVHCAGAAAVNAEPGDIDAMQAAVSHMQFAKDAASFVDADIAFHEAVAKSSGNRLLAAFIRSLRPLLYESMLTGTRLKGARESSMREHAAILDAIGSGNEPLARRLMTEHLNKSYQVWHDAEWASSAR